MRPRSSRGRVGGALPSNSAVSTVAPRRLLVGVPTFIALATVALGLADIATALAPERTSRLRALVDVEPLQVAHDARAATIVAGLLLVMLGHGLRRRKRRAWRAAVALTAATAILHVLKGLDYDQAVGSLLLCLLLGALHRQFFALGDPRTRWRAPATFVALAGASFGIGWLLLLARSGSVAGHPTAGARWQEVAYGLIGFSGPLHFRSDGTADLVYVVLAMLGAVTLGLPIYLALRSPQRLSVPTDEDEGRVRDLLRRREGGDSLGYFALRRDKAVIFSASGKSAVSYRVLSGVMLASGDPIGDPEAWPGAINEFIEEAARHAWIPAVIGCSERGGEVWVREAGLRALELGDEAIVDVATFTLEGREMRNVRQMARRVERAGYRIEVRRVADMCEEEVAAVRQQSAAWRGAEVERGFSMALGRLGDAADGGCVVVTCTHQDRLAAVLHFVPWGDDGLSLDLMRRDRSADPGLNEAMIVAAVQAAPEFGVRRLSLNFAAFRSALEQGARLGAGPISRLWRGALVWASRWYQIESLYKFNAKFAPQWRPRYICYPRSTLIPRIAVAALEAEALIVLPRPSRRRAIP
ncbi:MAG TPA: phosphatidylglycerol lysyltransferase domain-containing protein [Mycobacteriales bacterium]|nr:phosphatidylglycerol lysyltransferase domain-containing protein [Mycobacteriales bacterium]